MSWSLCLTGSTEVISRELFDIGVAVAEAQHEVDEIETDQVSVSLSGYAYDSGNSFVRSVGVSEVQPAPVAQ